MRGDVHRLKSNRDARGHEQTGHRYGIVLQADALLMASTWFVVPTSASAGSAIYRPEITIGGSTTRALCEQARGIDPEARLGERVAHLARGDLVGIEHALRLLLDL